MKTRDGVVNSHKKKTTIMCTRKKGNKPDPAGFSRLVWPFLVVALAIGSLLAGAQRAVAAPVCVVDAAGADDINANQKDLNEFCLSPGNDGGLSGCLSSDANLTWTWDDAGWTGGNTGDACALYDTDGDGNANFALCVTVAGDPAAQSSGSPKFYSCDDTSRLRCNTATQITTASSACAVTSVTDVFGTSSHKSGNICAGTDCLTKDTQAQCCVKSADLPTTAELIDVCSYPSSSPGSSPSDCIEAVLCNNDVDCASLDDQCNVGACVSDGLTKGCVATPRPNGTSCNDGNACTQTDTCQTGVCTGNNPVVCTNGDQCNEPGSCVPATGACSAAVLKANGTTCNDSNARSQAHTSELQSLAYNECVLRIEKDQCHVAGTWGPASGPCSNP